MKRQRRLEIIGWVALFLAAALWAVCVVEGHLRRVANSERLRAHASWARLGAKPELKPSNPPLAESDTLLDFPGATSATGDNR